MQVEQFKINPLLLFWPKVLCGAILLALYSKEWSLWKWSKIRYILRDTKWNLEDMSRNLFKDDWWSRTIVSKMHPNTGWVYKTSSDICQTVYTHVEGNMMVWAVYGYELLKYWVKFVPTV